MRDTDVVCQPLIIKTWIWRPCGAKTTDNVLQRCVEKY